VSAAVSHAVYVGAGWSVSLAAIALYAAWTLRRGRVLSRKVPPEERRWS
jgi:hypothetical protein